MARRMQFLVTVTDAVTGEELARETKQAMNSGIRESEALVRRLARAEATQYAGAAPLPRERNNPSSPYVRRWTSDATGSAVIARVTNIA